MTPSEMRSLLARNDIRLTRSLGQSFLHDANQVRRIVEAAAVKPGDQVLEVGPGLGPLTEELLAQGARVLAIEKDARLVNLLRQRFPAEVPLELIHADALDWLRESPRDWSDWKLVSNLPYSVGSPILVELALAPRSPERLVVTLQLEVIQRLRAAPGSGDFGILTLLAQLRYEPTAWFKIPPACFFPAPDVTSACLTLVRRQALLLEEPLVPLYVRLVKQGFSQRRKQLAKVLHSAWPALPFTDILAGLQLPPGVRAEQLGVPEFVALTRRVDIMQNR